MTDLQVLAAFACDTFINTYLAASKFQLQKPTRSYQVPGLPSNIN